MLPIFVRDVMTETLMTLGVGDRVSLADRIMQLARIRHLPVVDDEYHLVGLVTHRDLLAASVSTTEGLDSREDRRFKRTIEVAKIMRTNVMTVSPSTPLVEAAKLMRTHMFGCLPVVEDQRLVGLVTEADLVETLVRLLEGTMARDE